MNQSQKVKIIGILIAIAIFLAGIAVGYFIDIYSKNNIDKNVTDSVKISPTSAALKFSEDELIKVQEMELSLRRCGDLPDIEERSFSTSRMNGSVSEAVWSPNCKYILWFQYLTPFTGGALIYDYNDGELLTPTLKPTPYVAAKNEGVFLLNTCSGKSERIYIPKSQTSIKDINWIDNEQLSFFADKTEFIYSLTDKNYVENKTN